MRNKIILFLAIATALIAVTSCSRELELHEPIINDPTVPAQVTNITVKNENGKATITYNVPNDPHLQYVKAVYTLSNGQQGEAKASYYTNSLLVEGFADTLEHEVKLYSVNRSELASAAVIVKVKPLESPLWKVYRSINIVNAFGGYNLSALNLVKANITIEVTKKNVFNEYERDNDKSIYTNVDSIALKVRGLDTIEYRFGFVVKDRWGNKTDTIYKIVKPFYEVQFPSANFSTFTLPGDAKQVTNGAALQYAWDGLLGWPLGKFYRPGS